MNNNVWPLFLLISEDISCKKIGRFSFKNISLYASFLFLKFVYSSFEYIVFKKGYYSFIMYKNGSLLYYESISHDLIQHFSSWVLFL